MLPFMKLSHVRFRLGVTVPAIPSDISLRTLQLFRLEPSPLINKLRNREENGYLKLICPHELLSFESQGTVPWRTESSIPRGRGVLRIPQ